jgi:hypothetical protein
MVNTMMRADAESRDDAARSANARPDQVGGTLDDQDGEVAGSALIIEAPSSTR